MADRNLQLTMPSNLGPAVFIAGLLLALLNVVSCPVIGVPLIEVIPRVRRLDLQTQSWFSVGFYLSTVGVAALGAISFATLFRHAKRAGRPQPSYAVFRPYIWIAVINLAVIGIFYVAFRLW